jgi:hypothetical protein
MEYHQQVVLIVVPQLQQQEEWRSVRLLNQ